MSQLNGGPLVASPTEEKSQQSAQSASISGTLPPAANSANEDSTGRPRKRKVTTLDTINNGSTDLHHTTSHRSTRSNRAATNNTRSMSVLQRITSAITAPGKPIAREPTIKESMMSIVKASWLNVLLVFVPVSWALHFALDGGKSTNDTVIFVTCFLAIIPLAKLLAFGTEELAIRVGQTLGGLLNATLGNVVELIVGVIALVQCKLRVVQSSLVGSILSNLLLVLGMCFFAGGTRFSEQGFMAAAAQLNTSLLILSVTAILIPAAFRLAIVSQNLDTTTEAPDVLKMSRGVAIILLAIYGCTLVFQLWSHAHLYAEDGEHSSHAAKSTRYPAKPPKDPKEKKEHRFHVPGLGSHKAGSPIEEEQVANGEASSTTQGGSDEVAAANGDLEAQSEEDEDEAEVPQLTVWVAFGLLVAVTVLVAVTAEFLVSSIDGLTASGSISEEWVGLILLPIVGNAAEHVTAVTVSVKDKLDLSIGVAVGSSIQIALFVIPLLIMLAWILGKPLTLLFDPFESIVLFLSVLTVAFCINDGKSNWLEGMILMSLYVILATAFWFYRPSTDNGCVIQI